MSRLSLTNCFNNLTTKEKCLVLLYLGVLSFTILLVFSFTTSPLYGEAVYHDTAIFWTVGKGWVHGLLPYVDLWDLKGPIIFFINAIGYLLTGNILGVFVIQFFTLFITLCILYVFLREYFKPFLCTLLLLIPAASFSYGIQGGGCVEEYMLPWLAGSYYAIWKWVNSIENKGIHYHPSRYAFLYGVTFAFALLTRLTNALGICAAIAIIIGYLVCKKKWLNLFHNAISFIIGFLVLSVPFVVYFWAKGALYEMWYGTILYNIDYLTESDRGLKSIIDLLIIYRDTWLLLFLSIALLCINKTKKLVALTFVCISTVQLVWFMNGNGYAHYGIITIPLLVICFIMVHDIVNVQNRLCEVSLKLVMVLFTIYTLRLFVFNYQAIDIWMARNKEWIDKTEVFMKSVPPQYKDSFVGYQGQVGFVYKQNIIPACRFFSTQDFEADKSKVLQKLMRKEFEKKKIKWILVDCKAKAIDSILDKDYIVYKMCPKSGLTLYKRK